MVKIVATTSLPVDRLTATDCNAAARANKFFDLSTPSMRKSRDGEKKENGGIVATTLLPVDRLMVTDCNVAAFAN